MYEVFGEFDNADEINGTAAGLLAAGDHKNILVLAKENGLDKEIAQAYIDGDIPMITTPLMAAVGKLEIERKSLKLTVVNDIKDDLINYLMTSCSDDEFAKAVRKKGKSLQKCMETCEKKITDIALKGRNGAKQVSLAVRNADVYLMERDYYLK